MAELETATDDEITADDDTSEDPSEDNGAVLCSIATLELIPIDGELLMYELEKSTDDEITADDDTRETPSEDNTAVL